MPHNNNLRKIEDKVDRLQRKTTNQNNLINSSISLNDDINQNLDNLLEITNQNVELDNYDRLPYGIYKRLRRDIFVDKDASVNLQDFNRNDLFPGVTSLKIKGSLEGRGGYIWAISGQTDKRDDDGNLVYKDAAVNVTLSESTEESVKITFSQPHGLNPFENRIERMVRQVHYKLNWGDSSSELESRFFLNIPNANEIVIEKSLLTDSDWNGNTSGTFQLSEYQDIFTLNTVADNNLYYDEFTSQYKNSDDTPIKILKKSEGDITSYAVFDNIGINTFFIDDTFQNVLIEEYLGNPAFVQFLRQNFPELLTALGLNDLNKDSLPFNTYAFNPVRPLFTLDSEINPENGKFTFSFDKLRTGIGLLLLIPVTLWKEKYESALLKNDDNGDPIVPDVEEVITEFYKGLSPIELGNLNLNGTVQYGLETEYNIWKGLVSMNGAFYQTVQTIVTQYISGLEEPYDILLTNLLGTTAAETIASIMSSGVDQLTAIATLSNQLLGEISTTYQNVVVEGLENNELTGPIIGLLNINGYTIPSPGVGPDVGPELFSDAYPFLGIAGKIASGQEVRTEFLNDFTELSPFVLEILANSGNDVSDVGARWLKTPDKIILNVMYDDKNQNEASKKETDLLANTHQICTETNGLNNSLFADKTLSPWHDICPDLFPDFPLIRHRRFNFEPSINQGDEEKMGQLIGQVSGEIQTAATNGELTSEQQQTLATTMSNVNPETETNYTLEEAIALLIGQEVQKRVADTYYVPIFLVSGATIVQEISETNFGNIGSLAFGPYITLTQLAGLSNTLPAVPLYSVEDQSQNDVLPDTLLQDIGLEQLEYGFTCEILEVRQGISNNNTTINLWKSVHNNLISIDTNEYLEVAYNREGQDIYRSDYFGTISFISKNENNEDQIILLLRYFNEAPNNVPNNSNRYFLSSLVENPLLKVSIFQFEDVVDGKIKTLGLIDQNNNVIVLSVICNDEKGFPLLDGYPSNNLRKDYPPFLPAPPPTTEAPVQPIIIFPADVTLELGNNYSPDGPGGTGTPTAEDSEGDLIVNLSFQDEVVQDEGNNFIVTRNWTVTEENGRVTTGVQTITILDTTAPTFTFFPDDVTLNSGENTDPVNTGTPTFSDNSQGDFQVVPLSLTYVDTQETDTNGNTFITRTWTVTDGNYNNISRVQTITVLPETLPDIQPISQSFNREAQTLTVVVRNNGNSPYAHTFVAISKDNKLNTHTSDESNDKNYNMTGAVTTGTSGLVISRVNSNGTENAQPVSYLSIDRTFQLKDESDNIWTIPADSEVTYTFNFSNVTEDVKNQMQTDSNDTDIYLIFNEDGTALGGTDESNYNNNTIAFSYQKPLPDIAPISQSFNREAQTLTVVVRNNGNSPYTHGYVAISKDNELNTHSSDDSSDRNYIMTGNNNNGLVISRVNSSGTTETARPVTFTFLNNDRTFQLLNSGPDSSSWTIPANTTYEYKFDFSNVTEDVKNQMQTDSNGDNEIYLIFNEDGQSADRTDESNYNNNTIAFSYQKPLPDIAPISQSFNREAQTLTVVVRNNGYSQEYTHRATAFSRTEEKDKDNYSVGGINVTRSDNANINIRGPFGDNTFQMITSEPAEDPLVLPANTTETYTFNFSGVSASVKEEMDNNTIYLIFNEDGDDVESDITNNSISFTYQLPEPLPDIQPISQSFNREAQTLTVVVRNNGNSEYTHGYIAISKDNELNTHGSDDNKNYNMTGAVTTGTPGLEISRVNSDGITESAQPVEFLSNDRAFRLLNTNNIWTIPADSEVTYTFNFSNVTDAVKEQMASDSSDTGIYLIFNEDGTALGGTDESEYGNNTISFTYELPLPGVEIGDKLGPNNIESRDWFNDNDPYYNIGPTYLRVYNSSDEYELTVGFDQNNRSNSRAGIGSIFGSNDPYNFTWNSTSETWQGPNGSNVYLTRTGDSVVTIYYNDGSGNIYLGDRNISGTTIISMVNLDYPIYNETTNKTVQNLNKRLKRLNRLIKQEQNKKNKNKKNKNKKNKNKKNKNKKNKK